MLQMNGSSRRIRRAAVVALASALSAPAAWSQVSLLFSGHLESGGTVTSGLGISADGRYVVGSSRAYPALEQAIRWDTHAGSGASAMVAMGDLPGGLNRSNGYGISGDGSIVVGTSASSNSAFESYRWTQGTGIVGIGDIPGGAFQSNAWDISGNGQVIVGSGFSANGGRAYAWTQDNGFETLNLLPNATGSEARTVSSNGRYVGVNSFVRPDPNSPSVLTASIYDRDTGSHINVLSPLTPNASLSIYKVADDAQSATGSGTFTDGDGNRYSTAHHWTISGGTESLGILGEVDTGASIVRQSEAFDMSADGRVVVGSSTNDGRFFEAFVWDADHGMRSLEDVVRDAGIDLGDWWLERATGISADGRYITGFATHQDVNSGLGQQAFVIMIPEPATGMILAFGALLGLRRRR